MTAHAALLTSRTCHTLRGDVGGGGGYVLKRSVRRALSVNRVRGTSCARVYSAPFTYCASATEISETFLSTINIYISLRVERALLRCQPMILRVWPQKRAH